MAKTEQKVKEDHVRKPVWQLPRIIKNPWPPALRPFNLLACAHDFQRLLTDVNTLAGERVCTETGIVY